MKGSLLGFLSSKIRSSSSGYRKVSPDVEALIIRIGFWGCSIVTLRVQRTQ